MTEPHFRFVQQVSRQAGGHACETDLWEGRRSHSGGVSLDAVDLHGVGPDILSLYKCQFSLQAIAFITDHVQRNSHAIGGHLS